MKTDKKKQKTPKRVILVRIMAAFLGLLMILGVFAMALPLTSYASEPQYQFTSDLIRVGLMYGTGVTVGFEITTEYGFEFGMLQDGENYIPLYQVTDTIVSVTCDANLSKKAMTYSIGNASNAVIGGWHAQVTTDAANLQTALSQIKTAAKPMGLDAFPAYINGSYVVRVGDFTTEAEAQQTAAAMTQYFGANFTVVSGTNTAVSVVNPNTDAILYEFDDSNSSFGVKAVQGENEAYIVTPAKNKYKGVFEFTRYIYNNTNGVAVTNVMPLEEYVACVISCEVSPNWPIETLKAFAVTVRSFTLAKLGRHNTSYGFDLCNSTHCQAYLGVARVNDAVRTAIEETRSLVVSYKDNVAEAYYSSSVGGVTVSAKETWGSTGDYSYLQAVNTPWEKYKEHYKGYWTVEMTPKELADQLRSAGYSQIRGNIQSVKINKLAENSSYVYSISFTDTNGNTVTIERTEKIKIALSLNSANFVVGKAGDTLQMTEYVFADALDDEGNLIDTEENKAATEEITVTQEEKTSPNPNVITADGVISVDSDNYFAVNSLGMTYLDNSRPIATVTSQGDSSVTLISEFDLEFGTDSGTINIPEIPENAVLGKTTTVTTTVKAEGTAGSFIFIGRGWGHGVGFSQWGAHDMAELGFKWRDIVNAYFPGTQITDYRTILVKN